MCIQKLLYGYDNDNDERYHLWTELPVSLEKKSFDTFMCSLEKRKFVELAVPMRANCNNIFQS